MGVEALIVLVFIAGLAGLCVLTLVFGYRTRDLLFLMASLLPMVWMSRLNQYSITIGKSSFVLLWAVFGLLFVLGMISGNRQTKRLLRQPSRKLAVLLGALVGVMLLSTFFNASDSNDLIRGLNAVLFVVLPFLAAWGVVNWCRAEEASIQRAILSLCLVGILLSLMSVLSAVMPGLFRGLMRSHLTEADAGRAFTPLGGANVTGMVLLLVYCLAFGQLMAKRQRVIGGITIALCFLGILTTLARAALVGVVVSTLFLLLSQRRGIARRLMLFSAVGMFLLVPLAYKLGQRYSLERFNLTSSGSMSGASVAGRSMTMKASLHYAINHPFLGGGWGLVYQQPRDRVGGKWGASRTWYTFMLEDYHSMTKPHCLLALTLVESGVLALVILGLFLWAMWKALELPNPNICPEGAAVIQGFRAGVLGFFLISLVQDSLFLADKVAYYFYLYFFTGLATTMYYRTTTQFVQSLSPSQTVPTLGESPVPEA